MPGPSSSSNPLAPSAFVVAIDFGTTFSGYALCKRDDSKKIITKTNWPGTNLKYPKTPTHLLYRRNETGLLKAIEWGGNAEKKYFQLCDDFRQEEDEGLAHTNKENAFLLIHKFKLLLSESEEGKARVFTFPSSAPVQTGDLSQVGLTVDKAISDYLRFMKDMVLSDLKNSFGEAVEPRHLQWALTVPAIWSVQARHRMQKAAESAGMISPYPVEIILEPEAASVDIHVGANPVFKEAVDQFLIVDAGGGTVDLVIHAKDGGTQLKEVTLGSGELCGSTFVDDCFFKHLATLIPPSRDYLGKNPTEYAAMKGTWENFKCDFGGEDDDPKFLQLSLGLTQAWQQSSANEPLSAAQKTGKVKLTVDIMLKIFQPAVDGVLKLIEDQLRKAQAPSSLALLAVGGFSSSPYLMKRIRDRFQRKVRHIISSDTPGLAICQGAVKYLLQPEIVSLRLARRTYGVSCNRPFEEGDDPPERRVVVDGEVYCGDSFAVFVTIGDKIPANKTVTHKFSVCKKDSSCVTIAVYSTLERAPRFIDMPGTKQEVVFPLSTPKSSDCAERGLEVTFFFGGTVITASAKCMYGSFNEAFATIDLKS